MASPDRSAAAVSRSASRRAPAPVTVRSMAFSSEPSRLPESVRSSSRLARVAGSMNSVEAASSRGGSFQRRPLGLLRLLDISDGPRDRRQLGAREGAEAVGRGDAIEASDAGGRRGRIEEARRLRVNDAAEQVEGGPELGVVESRLGDDQLLGVDAHDVRRRAGRRPSRRPGRRPSRCRSRPGRSRRRRHPSPGRAPSGNSPPRGPAARPR